MLKPKTLPATSGAENLASLMMDYTRGMNVHSIGLEELWDAPDEWNFFKALPESKFFELVASIEENGLLSPLVVWERDGGGYMILSGHNRKRALEILYAKTGDRRFAQAPCVAYRRDALMPDEARAILVDCNWVQRTLSTAEKARAIYTKYVELGRRKPSNGEQGRRRYDDVAEHFGLKATQVYNYYRLAQLEQHWLDLLDAGDISIKAASRLASLTRDQRELLLKYPALSSKQILAIDACFTDAEIHKALAYPVSAGPSAVREMRFLVPAHLHSAVKELVEEFLKEEA